MINKLFKDNQRIDGRNIHEYRNISIRFPKNSNKLSTSCLVSFGKTSVLSRISSEVVEPDTNHPSRGLINFNLDTSFLKDDSNKLREATDEALKLEPIIKDCLRDAIDMDSLCICAGERVFCINIDIKAQTDDGNLLDVIVLAALIGLKAFKRPDVTIGESGNIIVHEDMKEKEPVPLQLKQLPVFVTLGIAVESNLIILDLNKLEEVTLDSKVPFGMSPSGELYCMNPQGSNLWTNSYFLDRCVKLVQSKVIALKHLITQAVQAQESSNQTIVINSASFIPNHPIFDDNKDLDVDVEEEKIIHDAPEALDGSDDMEIDSDNDAADVTNDDWNRIDSLISHTQTIASQKS